MRLAFLGSAESIHTVKWANFFAERGIVTLLVSLHPSRQPLHEAIELQNFSGLSFPQSGWKARRKLANWRPDIVHCHSVGTYGLLTLLSAPKTSKLVTTPWGSDILFGSKHPLKRPVIRSILKRSDIVTADAQFVLDLACTLGASQADCRIINFGIDTNRFSPAPVDLELLERYGIPNDGPRIISTRNFEPVYDIETLLSAMQTVLKENPACRLVLLGSGSLEASLKATAKTLGIAERVHFVGRVPNADLPALLNSQSVYVSTSTSDAGIASSTAEAMSCSLPAVISDAAENSLWVSNAENGYLFPTGDAGALAESLLKVLEESSSLDTLRKNARQTIIDRNDYNNEMEKMRSVYASLCL